MKQHTLKTRRVYDVSPDTNGYRILVDRLWPRGLRKEALRLDSWAKGVAPSPGLRKWFGHAAERFPAFADFYRAELEENPEAERFVQDIRAVLSVQDVLLLYAARDSNCNHAIVLKDWIREKLEH